MELHQLRYVLGVARTGNFTRAAEQCHVAQPSLSQQIQKLEEELGGRLFERRRDRTRLTFAGERFVERAARILDEIAEAGREAQESHGVIRGRVVVGAIPTIAPYLLPRVIAAFRARHPGVAVVLREETTAELVKLVADYEVDFAIASEPLGSPMMRVQPLFTEELLLAIPHGHALAKRPTPTVRDLENEAFLLLKDDHCLSGQVLDFCSRRNLTPLLGSRTVQLETIQSLVRSGLGISLVPVMAKRTGREAPLYRSLAKPVPRRAIVAFHHRERPPERAAAEFWKVTRELTVPPGRTTVRRP